AGCGSPHSGRRANRLLPMSTRDVMLTRQTSVVMLGRASPRDEDERSLLGTDLTAKPTAKTTNFGNCSRTAVDIILLEFRLDGRMRKTMDGCLLFRKQQAVGSNPTGGSTTNPDFEANLPSIERAVIQVRSSPIGDLTAKLSGMPRDSIWRTLMEVVVLELWRN